MTLIDTLLDVEGIMLGVALGFFFVNRPVPWFPVLVWGGTLLLWCAAYVVRDQERRTIRAAIVVDLIEATR